MKSYIPFVALIVLLGVGAVAIAVQVNETIPAEEAVVVLESGEGPWRLFESEHGLFFDNQQSAQVWRYLDTEGAFLTVEIEVEVEEDVTTSSASNPGSPDK